MLFDECIKLLHALWIRIGEVVLLANILFEIEKLVSVSAIVSAVKDADQFPVVVMNGD